MMVRFLKATSLATYDRTILALCRAESASVWDTIAHPMCALLTLMWMRAIMRCMQVSNDSGMDGQCDTDCFSRFSSLMDRIQV
jgi:hypothetical protein